MATQRVKQLLPLLVLVALALAPMSAVDAAALSESTLVISSPLAQAAGPVTLYSASTEQIATLDPQRTEDNVSIQPVENLFLGLTDYDPQTNQVVPELATSWERNDGGDVWTFNLRDDVPWVRYNPSTKEFTEVRKVVAGDFVYGIQRACDPRIGAYYSGVAAAMIKGCDVAFNTPVEEIGEATFEQVGVRALSDTQLEITLQGPLSFFESASGMWMLRAVPRETIEEFGDAWIEPGNIVTNGPYALEAWDRTVNRIYVKNPLLPADVNDYGGNIERIETVVIADGSTIFSLYQNNEVETTGVPQSELQRIQADPELSKELIQIADLTVYYFGFGYDKPPFDNVHVRRAFSAAIDRQAFVSEVQQGRGIPMAHFMPPGIIGAVPINEVGVGQPNTPGFDAEYAKAEMEAAGYPNCEGFPEYTVVTYQGASDWAEFLQNAAQNVLGCDPGLMTIEELEFTVLLRTIRSDTPTIQRPNMWTLGWGPDYPDAHNWVHDVLGCESENPFLRPCNDAIDGVIDAAATEANGPDRLQMYRDVEEAFFSPEGDFPIAPLFMGIGISMVKPWYTGPFTTDGVFGGAHWSARSIDQAAQLAARGG
ncbi:MAG: peptide ABC transporter substrate-binding protein [Anaerolineae bacterium]|nr:peptide ABC transporter substrate-binding protein [Anaerolineae bacterium]